LQEKWRSELKLEKEAAEKIYSFLEWCDAFSLLMCPKQHSAGTEIDRN
jgi:hypothetical protein